MPKTIGDEIRRMTVAFEVKAVKEESDGKYAGEFTGYAAGIHNIDRVGDMILPGAFTDDLPRFLQEGVVCWQHDWMTPIGVPLEASEDGYGLMTKSRISNTTQGKDAMTLIRDKVVKKLSIGYRVNRLTKDGKPGYEWVDRAELIAYLNSTNLPEQRKQEIIRTYDEMKLDELLLLRSIKLYEYSPVTVPANPNASITAAKNLLTGLTFADHSKAVLTAVRGLTERAQGIVALKLKQGRKTKLNAERRSELEEIADSLSHSLESLRGLLNEPSEPKSDEAARLFAEYQKLEARILGVAA